MKLRSSEIVIQFPPRLRAWQHKLPTQHKFRDALIAGIVMAILSLTVFAAQWVQQADLRLTNLLYVPPNELSDKVVIVAIDDASLSAYGRSLTDWPRTLHADLLRVLSKAGARVVAFDVLFPDSSPMDGSLANAIRAAQESESRTRVVFAVAGRGDARTDSGQAPYFDRSLLPTQPLSDAAKWLGHVSIFPDVDGFVRRVPLLITASNQSYVSFGVAAYLGYLRIPPDLVAQVVKRRGNVIEITPQRAIPVDDFGQMMMNYFGPQHTFPSYSYRDVLHALVDPAAFDDKIVLVGQMGAAGLIDGLFVPISVGDELMSGVEIHANIVETLIQNRPLTTQSRASQAIMVVLLALLAGLVFAQLRWPWAIALYLVIVLMTFLFSSVIFSAFHHVIPIFYPSVALTLALMGSLVATIRTEASGRRQINRLLDEAIGLIERRAVLDDVLKYVSDALSARLGAVHSAIWLWNEEKLRLELAYSAQGKSPGDFPATAEQQARQALNAYQLIARNRIVAIPLRLQNKPVAVYAAERGEQYLDFSVGKLVLASYFMGRIAPAIANARTYTLQLRQRELLETILMSTPNPVLVIDHKGKLLEINREARALLATGETLPTLHVDSLLRAAGASVEALNDIDDLLAENKPFQREVTLRDRTYILHVGPLRVDQGGSVLVFNDVTVLKELDELKTRMIRMASHDLKSPLSVIFNMVYLLTRETVTPNQSERLQVLRQSAERMNSIISNVLDLERLKMGSGLVEPLNIVDVVRRAVAEHHSRIEQKKQTLALDLPSHEVIVDGDRDQLFEAVSNLIDNAIKYTPDEGHLEIKLTPEDAAVQLTVIDTGCGIPREAQRKLFQPFYRVRTPATARIQGSGLGLSIVKAVVDAHGGQISVDSEEGNGSTFNVKLPLAVPKPAATT